jgi:hypothetical protein
MSNHLFRPAIASILGGLFCQIAQAAIIATSSTHTGGFVVVCGVLLLLALRWVVRRIARVPKGEPSGGGSAGFTPGTPGMGMNNPTMGADSMASRVSTVDGSIQPNRAMRDAHDAQVRAQRINEQNRKWNEEIRKRTQEQMRRTLEENRRRAQENARRNRPF